MAEWPPMAVYSTVVQWWPYSGSGTPGHHIAISTLAPVNLWISQYSVSRKNNFKMLDLPPKYDDKVCKVNRCI